MNDNKYIILGAVFLIIGVIVAIIGTIRFNSYRNAIDNGEVTEIVATVTESEYDRSSTRSKSRRYKYTDTFEYTVDDVTYTGTETESRSTVRHTTPTYFKIYYYNDNPSEHFRVSDTTIFSLLYVLIIPIGASASLTYGILKKKMIIM